MTKNEIKLYLVLLDIGESKTGALIVESKISSSKIYGVLDLLISKGLVSYILKDNIKYFRAQSPQQLKNLFDEKKTILNQQEKKINELVMDLEKKTIIVDTPSAEYFEGIKGVRRAHDILFSRLDSEELLYFYPYEEITADQDLFYKKLWLDHDYMSFNAKGLVVKNAKSVEIFEELEKQGEVKFVDIPLPGTIDIVGNMVLILSWTSKPTCVLIDSQEISLHFRNYFNSMWNL